MLKLRRSFPAVIALALCAGAFFCVLAYCADSKTGEVDDSFKATFKDFQENFNTTKEKVDSTVQYFQRFNEAISKWKNAVSNATQDSAIEDVKDLTGEQIDNLSAKLKDLTGLPFPDEVPDSIKSKITNKLLTSLQTKELGYMYTLSAMDKQFQANGLYDGLAAIKKGFETGSSLLKNMNNVMQFTDMFNPTTDGTPTFGLKKIVGVLNGMKDFTGDFPLIGDIIGGYADVTNGFVSALDGLNNKLKDTRDGSLGGQLGVDVGIKNRIHQAYGDIDELNFFSVNGDHPLLTPILGWQDQMDNTGVALYYGPVDGSGSVAMVTNATFEILYKYYAAMHDSDLDTSKKEYDPDMFMSRALAAGQSRDITSFDTKYRGYYVQFDGQDSNKFTDALKAAGKVDKDNYLISVDGQKLNYQLCYQASAQKASEFAGLCYYETAFRTGVEGLLANYLNQVKLDGAITNPNGGPVDNLSVKINGIAVTGIQSTPKGSMFEISVKAGPYDVEASAPGYKDYVKTGEAEGPLNLQMEQEVQSAPSVTILGPDTADNAVVNNYTVDFGTNTQVESDCVFLWHAGNIKGDATKESVNVVFAQAGDNSVSVDVSSSKGLFTAVTISKKVKVTAAPAQAAASVASLSLLSPTCWPGQPEDITITIAGLSKSTYSAVGLIVAEKTSNTLLSAPDPFVPPGSAPVQDGPHILKYNAPQSAGNYTITLEVHGKASDGTDVLLGKDQKNFTVGSAAVSAPDQANPGDTVQASLTASDALFQTAKKILWNAGGGGTISNQDPSGKSAKILIASNATITPITATVVFSGVAQCVLEKDVSCNTAAPAAGPVVSAAWTRNFPNATRAEVKNPGGTAEIDASIAYDQDYGLNDAINGGKKAWKAYCAGIDQACTGNTATKFTDTNAQFGPVKGVIYSGAPYVLMDGEPNPCRGGGQGYCSNDLYDAVKHMFTFQVSGNFLGVASNQSDADWMKSEANKATKECIALIQIETYNGNGQYATQQAPTPPKITLTADKPKLRRGDSATLTVSVAPVPAGESPLTYTWNGNVASFGQTATFLAAISGKQTVSVTVGGKKTASLGTASLDITVGDFSITLKKTSPSANDIPVGTQVTFSATVLDGGKAPSPAPVLRWQPNSAVAFNPTEVTATQSAATFSAPGKVSVWVEALENDAGTLNTIGTSDTMDLNIILPQINVTAFSNSPMVGDQVTLQAVSAPPITNIDYRWDIPANAKLVSESKDDSSIIISLMDDKDVVVTANARVPVSGEALGSGQCKLTAADYDVTVNVEGPEGPRPMLWVEGKGLVEDTKGIETGQNVKLKASISPKPANPLRWKWTLDDESTIVSGGTSQELTANRSSEGDCTADVEVDNADGVVLGKGSGCFSVNVTQNDITVSKNKSDAHDKLAQAKAMIPLGKLDEAITLCDQAAAEEPDLQEAKDLSAQLKDERTKISLAIDMMHKGIFLKNYDDATSYWNTANGLSPKYAPVIAAKKDLDDALKAAAQAKKDSDAAAAARQKADQLAKDKADKEKADKEKADQAKTTTGPSSTAKGTGGAAAAGSAVLSGGKAAASGTAAMTGGNSPQYKAAAVAGDGERYYQMYLTSIVNGAGVDDQIALLTTSVNNYQKSLKIINDPAARKRMAEIQAIRDGLVNGKKNAKQAQTLKAKADTLASKKKYTDAIAAYQAALAIKECPDRAGVQAALNNADYQDKSAQADLVKADGDKALKAGDILSAVTLYDKAYKAYPPTNTILAQLKAQISALKSQVAAGQAARKSGEASEKKGKLQKAIDYYVKSVAQLPNAQLSAHIEELKIQLAASQAPAQGSGQALDTDAVKQFYVDFKKAYESKNELKVMSMVSPDWTAGDGTSCSDLRDTLHTSFGMFDEINYIITSLTVQPSKGGACTASYKLKITGKIYENNITHEEESSVAEQVGPDERGKLRIIKTGEGNFWHIE